MTAERENEAWTPKTLATNWCARHGLGEEERGVLETLFREFGNVLLERAESVPAALRNDLAFRQALIEDRLDLLSIGAFADKLEEEGRTVEGARVRRLLPQKGDLLVLTVPLSEVARMTKRAPLYLKRLRDVEKQTGCKGVIVPGRGISLRTEQVRPGTLVRVVTRRGMPDDMREFVERHGGHVVVDDPAAAGAGYSEAWPPLVQYPPRLTPEARAELQEDIQAALEQASERVPLILPSSAEQQTAVRQTVRCAVEFGRTMTLPAAVQEPLTALEWADVERLVALPGNVTLTLPLLRSARRRTLARLWAAQQRETDVGRRNLLLGLLTRLGVTARQAEQAQGDVLRHGEPAQGE